MSTRCAEHAYVRRPRPETRDSARTASYSTAHWRKVVRPFVLARDPMCRVCALNPSTVADHFPLERTELVAMGEPDPDDPAWLRGVCKPCHDSKSARYGNARRARR